MKWFSGLIQIKIILLEANPLHPGSGAVVGSYMYLELAADEGKKSNEPFLCLPAYMHSPEIYCHFTTSCVRSLVVFNIQWLFLDVLIMTFPK